MLEKWNNGMVPFGQINASGRAFALPPQAVKKSARRAQIPLTISN